MTDQPCDRLPEVLRLTTALADCVLDAQIMQRPVAEDQVRALAGAARLLREHGVEWPPLLTQVLHELAQNVGEDRPTSGRAADAEAKPKVASLRGFLGTLRGGRGQP